MRAAERLVVYGISAAFVLWALARAPSEAGEEGQDTLTVRTLQLVDAKGHVAAVLSTDGAGRPALRLMVPGRDAEGLVLTATETGGRVDASNAAGKVVASLGADDDGQGHSIVRAAGSDATIECGHAAEGTFLGVRGTDGGVRGGLVLRDDGPMRLRVGDAKGEHFAEIGWTTSGAQLDLPNATGAGTVYLGHGPSGGIIKAEGTDGTEIAYLGASGSNQAGLLILAAKDEARVVELGMDGDGGYASLRTPTGEERTFLGLNGGDGYVSLRGRTGKRAVVLTSGESGGYTSVYNVAEKQVAYVGASGTNQGGLLVLNDAEAQRGLEAVADTGGGYASFLRAGRSVLYAGVSSTNHGGLVKLMRQDGAVSVELQVDSDQGGRATLWNRLDQAALDLMATDAQGRGGLVNLRRAGGAASITLGVRPDGSGGIDTFDASGRVHNVSSR